MSKKILFGIVLIFLVGCASGDRPKISLYSLPENVEAAKIRFVENDPYIYKSGIPYPENTIGILNGVEGTYKNLSVIRYDDPANCVDFGVFNSNAIKNGFLEIQADVYSTFSVIISESSDGENVSCSNKITLKPTAGKEYTVKTSIHVTDRFDGECKIEVYEGDSKTPSTFIPRPNTPPFWSQASPKCAESELSRIQKATSIVSPFKCIVSIGGYRC
jgi:hypothetical protein